MDWVCSQRRTRYTLNAFESQFLFSSLIIHPAATRSYAKRGDMTGVKTALIRGVSVDMVNTGTVLA